MRSESVKELITALTAFQGKMTAVKKDSINPFYKSKYASLDTIWETIRKPLTDNGLSIAQTMNLIEDKSVLETTLYHTSGEWISGVQLVNPVKDDPQALGSAISYARRYSLSALLGIVADEDDDAETATPKAKEKPISTGGETSKKSETPDITPAQTKKIYATAKEKQLSPEEAKAYIKKTFNKNSTKELTKDEASTMIEFLNEIKPDEGHLVRATKEIGAKEE
jgi:hypothetical protein